jgi:putative membrane protein insertion efficiency factor
LKALYFLRTFPRNFLIAFILVWRKLISPLYGDVCRYYPSCSGYGLHALQQHGVLKGVPMTVWRILRCNPWSQGGVDEVKISKSPIVVSKLGFVSLNPDEKKR